jgi:hypothetical protein
MRLFLASRVALTGRRYGHDIPAYGMPQMRRYQSASLLLASICCGHECHNGQEGSRAGKGKLHLHSLCYRRGLRRQARKHSGRGNAMRKFLVHDTVNDVAIIQTSFGYNCRYGLQVTLHKTFASALSDFTNCVNHARACEGVTL